MSVSMKLGLMTMMSVTALAACGGLIGGEDDGPGPTSSSKSELGARLTVPNENGTAATLSVNGPIDTSTNNPFFRSLGTNGRTCGSCHVPDDNWTVTPASLQKRFDDTGGLDPIFHTNDGSTSPNDDVSTVDARRKAYAMLLTKGLIRVGIGVPANAEFELVDVDDPYGFASARELSLFRRPLPSTNLSFLTATMVDGRESTPIPDPLRGPNDTVGDLSRQANDATLGHAQAASDVPPDVLAQIVAFELGLFTAQATVQGAGSTSADGATGGPAALSTQLNYFGINDVVAGDSRSGAPFDPQAMTVFLAWTGQHNPRRAAIARGEALFDSKPIPISGVRGLNDKLGVSVLQGTCTTCHDSPNVGDHSVRLPIDIGTTDASRRTPDLPLYTLCKRQVDGSGVPIPGTCDDSVPRVQTSDPGRALITGKWGDMSTFKGPRLRGLAGRAPYFHNGSAATLADVVEFYDTRFGVGFTDQETSDLVAFLGAL